MSSRREKLGFTLVELVVAVGLLAMIFSFSGVIFKVCIKSHRMAVANAEIMQKFRVITDQINADFKGLRKDAPMGMSFWRLGNAVDPNRYDRIMFFADGDFSSVQPYRAQPDLGGPAGPDVVGQQIRGNVARICYGLAMQPTRNGTQWTYGPGQPVEKRILGRRQKILTADPDIYRWPRFVTSPLAFERDFTGWPPQPPYSHVGLENTCNERFEHDSLSLSEWMNVSWTETLVETTVALGPMVNLNDPTTLHKLWSEGVSDFAIEWAYRNDKTNTLCWFPNDEPSGEGDFNFDSHFEVNNRSAFTVLFNVPPGVIDPDGQIRHVEEWLHRVPESADDMAAWFAADFFPHALRFTFTIHDSKGVYPGGRKFTHIVYIGD